MGGLCEERSKKGRGGRPQLRWEDCVKRDLRKAEEEETLREKLNNRQWRGNDFSTEWSGLVCDPTFSSWGVVAL